MDNLSTVLTILTNFTKHQYRFPRGQKRSTWFEALIAKSFSKIFHLPYFDRNNDDSCTQHRVVWCGTFNPFKCAPGGMSDAIVYAHEFYCLLEPTLRRNTDQWAREYASSIRHYNSFSNREGLEGKDVYLLMVAPTIHEDTFESFKSKLNGEHNFVLLELSTLAIILETAILAFTIRHLELQKLFRKLIARSRNSSTLEQYRNATSEYITSWQNEVLQLEKNSFLAIKSYEAMKQILRGHTRDHVGVSEIVRQLSGRPEIEQYTALINERFTPSGIANSLQSESLGFYIEDTPRDKLFAPVPFVEYESRIRRKMMAVGEANE